MKNEKLFMVAKQALKLGWSLIPVNDVKLPLIPWKEFQERRASEEEVMAWFEKYPDMQLGVVTGEISNLTIVDMELGADFSLIKDKTFKVQTGGGGQHMYFQYEKDFKNAVRLLPLTDIRSQGGYCVTIGSVSKKGPYLIMDGCGVAKMSEKTKALLLNGKHVDSITPIVNTGEKSLGMKALANMYEGNGVGTRNDSMVKFIGYVITQIHPEDWEDKAWPVILEANLKNNPPLSENELRKSYDSIRQAEKSNSPDRWAVEPEKKIEFEDKLLVKKDYKNRYTWGTRGLDMAMAIIKRGNFIVLGAKSSSGKTTFAFDMAQKNALLGHKILFLSLEMDEKEVKESVARRSAGITIEEEYDYTIPEVKQGYFNAKISEIDAIKNLNFKGVRRGGGLKWEEILEIIYGYDDLDLIFIDNLDLIEGNKGENDLERQKRIVKKIMGFTSEKQIPIVLIHHYRKQIGKSAGNAATLDDLSGSMKIVDGADRIINITRNRNPEAIYPEKYKSMIYLQKGREYPDAIKDVYFINGTFVDVAPSISYYDPLEDKTPSEYLRENKAVDEAAIEAELEREHKENEAQAALFGQKD